MNCDPELSGRFHMITAHFDDPAAVECRTEWSDGGEVVREELEISVARFRRTLVITATQPLPNR